MCAQRALTHIKLHNKCNERSMSFECFSVFHYVIKSEKLINTIQICKQIDSGNSLLKT